MNQFLNAVKKRRSVYGLSKAPVIPDSRIEEIVEQSVLQTPTAFNSQSGRVVVLFNEQHDKLWDLTKEALRKVVPADSFGPTEEKINSFKNAHGTILFFEDQSVVQGLQEQFALYADNFPIWSQQSTGILQFVVWTALADEGVGASLQHYNPLIDEQVSAEWNIPSGWKLTAQMPFGKISAEPADKQFAPLDIRLKVFK